jgi:hypothetical protein
MTDTPSLDGLSEQPNTIGAAPAPRIVVTIAGGLVSEVHANVAVSLAVIDLDVEGLGDDQVHEIVETDGGPAEATISHWDEADIPQNPDWVDAIFAVLDDQAGECS